MGFHGREAVRNEYIIKVMAPYPDMTFPHDWAVYDYERAAVLVMVRNAFPPPYDGNGEPFFIPNISRLVYGGNGLWKEQQDWYNPMRHGPEAMKAWRKAGGKFQSTEELKMEHQKSKL